MVSYKALNTTSKRIFFHLYNIIWYVDTGQRVAICKNSVPNVCHIVRYIYAGQRFAPVEGPTTNACHAVRYADEGQMFALEVSIIS